MKNKRRWIAQLATLLICSCMLCFTSCTQKQRVHVYGEPQHELVKLLKQQNSLQVILHADLTSLLSDVKEK